MRLTMDPPRRPRNHGIGGRLTVLKISGKWHVLYVSQVSDQHIVWHTPIAGATTTSAWKNEVRPFDRWEDAMAHAATLRTYYGDQCRGDNLLFERRHGKVSAR